MWLSALLGLFFFFIFFRWGVPGAGANVVEAAGRIQRCMWVPGRVSDWDCMVSYPYRMSNLQSVQSWRRCCCCRCRWCYCYCNCCCYCSFDSVAVAIVVPPAAVVVVVVLAVFFNSLLPNSESWPLLLHSREGGIRGGGVATRQLPNCQLVLETLKNVVRLLAFGFSIFPFSCN